MKTQRIKKLIEASEQVFADGSLENGAIVAANSDRACYPSSVQDYRYVWVRDGAYGCMAADLLGLKDIPEKFFDWCLNRAEGFKETQLLCNAYHVNGTSRGTLVPPGKIKVPASVRQRYVHVIHGGTQFQPDQSGSLLIAIAHHIEHFSVRASRFDELIEKTASGICRCWRGGAFILPCYDLWEERCVLPADRGFHTYSLAMCIAGLRAAIALSGKKRTWVQTERQMSAAFEKACQRSAESIPRTYRAGKGAKRAATRREDSQPDTSLLGLVWPSGILGPSDEKMKATVGRIVEANAADGGGLLRYPNDLYCGGVRKGWVTLTGAGAWPLLSFWMAIYYCLRGDRGKAEKHFTWPLDKIDNFLPEQIFKDKSKASVPALLWSHAMFVIAARFLGYI